MNASGFRHLRHRPTLLLAIAIALVIDVALLPFFRVSTALLIGWCLGIAVYMGLVIRVMARATVDTIRRRAHLLQQGRGTILSVVVLAAFASLVAIVVAIAQSKGQPDAGFSVALGAATILLSWGFLHVVFAQHYAHDYWLSGCGLVFPGAKTPDYVEFLYFSFTIGMTAQVSDVTTESAAMRRLVLIHGILSFIFNTAILALTINIGASLIG